MKKNLRDYGLDTADILIPKSANLSKWSVVACDQYTSQPEYWEEVEQLVGQAPSMLRLVIPEIYLNDHIEDRIQDAVQTMKDYIADGLFQTYENAVFYIERTLSGGRVRRGLIMAADLEAYDFRPGSGSLIRATEGTILDRIPPRVKIRKDAPLESPHIMMLVDDEKDILLGGYAQAEKGSPVYDFSLMQGGGSIRGWNVGKSEHLLDALEQLSEHHHEKYPDKPTLLFAVGDGNHSLATAKACWEEIKPKLTESERATHPARYALVEIVNVHDAALVFEPIHRVVFGCQPADLLDKLLTYYPGSYNGKGEGQQLKYIWKEEDSVITIPNSDAHLPVGTLQKFLDTYILEKHCEVDYVHGEDVVRQLAAKEGNMGFILPAMPKSALFETVILDGVLPRKTFSMGTAEEKRYYLECRKIR